MSSLYKLSPVLVVADWSEVSKEEALLKFRPKVVKRDVVMVDYWLDRIQQTKDRYHNNRN